MRREKSETNLPEMFNKKSITPQIMADGKVNLSYCLCYNANKTKLFFYVHLFMSLFPFRFFTHAVFGIIVIYSMNLDSNAC